MAPSPNTQSRKAKKAQKEAEARQKEIDELKKAKLAMDAIFKSKKPAQTSPQRELSPSPKPKKAKKKKKKDAADARIDKPEEHLVKITTMMAQQLLMSTTTQSDRQQEPALQTIAAPQVPTTGISLPSANMAARPSAPLPPKAMLDDPRVAEHLAEALNNLDLYLGSTAGKKSSIYKPHMFIPVRFEAKKQSAQEDLSFPLYVNGITGIILNAISDQASRPASICRHLRELAEDVTDKEWQSV